MKTLYSIITLPWLLLFILITIVIFCPPMIFTTLKNKHEETEIDENGEEKTTVFIDFQSMMNWLTNQPLFKVVGKIPKEMKVVISVILWYFIFKIF